MDRATLEAHLMLAERHVAQGEEILVKQRTLIGELEGKGLDIRAAEVLLEEFEAVQAIHVAHRDRLVKTLVKSRV